MEDGKKTNTHNVVTIWDLYTYPPYELFFKFAYGFLYSAISILKEQQYSSERDYFKIMPAHFALEHSIELFLKGAILVGDKSISVDDLASKRFGHNLEELYKRYRQIYSSDKFKLYHRIDDLIDWHVTINDPCGFAARYPFDSKGIVYGHPNRMIDIEFELEIFNDFISDLERLVKDIMKKAGLKLQHIEQFHYRDER